MALPLWLRHRYSGLAAGCAIAEKPTVAELQAPWGPFAANAGTYELSDTTLTLHLVVSKEPRDQAAGTFARLQVKLDGDTPSLTPVANSRGPMVVGVTSRYVESIAL